MVAKPVDRCLLELLRESQEFGEGVRSPMWTGLFLGLCQHCGQFSGKDCPPYSGDLFPELLLDNSQRCPNWTTLHDERRDEE